MSKSFLQYVWSHSARAQIVILILTAAFFPLLYLTLDLPKQIINDAIGGKAFPVTIWGYEFEQISYLVTDIKTKGHFEIHLGVGHGWTSSTSDKRVFKALLGLPF